MRCKNSGYECLGYPKRKRISLMDDDLHSSDNSSSIDPLGIGSSAAAESSVTTSPIRASASQILDSSVLESIDTTLDLEATPQDILGTSPSSHSCSIIGKCILLGQPICHGCLATIQPVTSPSDPAQDFMMPTPFPSTPFPSSFDTSSRHQSVLHSLIGYYAVVITCWVEGCHPHSIVHSTFFKELVQYLFHRIDHDECLRLSIASCASGYIGGGQLSWPEDLKAIQEWTETLRNGATELVNVATTTSAPASRPLEDAHGDRLARHSYLDKHLSRHARYLYRMASKSMESNMQLYTQGPNSTLHDASTTSSTAYIDVSRMRQYNHILLSIMSQGIFSWAELSIESYYRDFDHALQIVHTIFGGVRKVKVKSLNSVQNLGFAIIAWADVAAALSRGTCPYFYLEDDDDRATTNLADTLPFQ